MASEPLTDEPASISVADAATTPSRGRRSRWFRRVLQVVGIAVGVVVALIGLEQLAYYNRILPGVQVDGVDVDQKTTARPERDRRPAEQLETEPIVATFGDQRRTIEPADIDLGSTSTRRCTRRATPGGAI